MAEVTASEEEQRQTQAARQEREREAKEMQALLQNGSIEQERHAKREAAHAEERCRCEAERQEREQQSRETLSMAQHDEPEYRASNSVSDCTLSNAEDEVSGVHTDQDSDAEPAGHQACRCDEEFAPPSVERFHWKRYFASARCS